MNWAVAGIDPESLRSVSVAYFGPPGSRRLSYDVLLSC